MVSPAKKGAVGVKGLLDALKVRTTGRRDRLCLAIKIAKERGERYS
jgi:hypothetical protein